jgi:hypothetical protein
VKSSVPENPFLCYHQKRQKRKGEGGHRIGCGPIGPLIKEVYCLTLTQPGRGEDPGSAQF